MKSKGGISKVAYDLARVIDAAGLSRCGTGDTYRSEGKADSPRLVRHKKPKQRKHGKEKTTKVGTAFEELMCCLPRLTSTVLGRTFSSLVRQGNLHKIFRHMRPPF